MELEIASLLSKSLREVVESKYVLSLTNKTKLIPELLGDKFYVELPQAGICLIGSFDGLVISIHLYSEGYEGYSQFKDQLPDKINFQDSRLNVHQKLTKDPLSTGGDKNDAKRNDAPWEIFDFGTYTMRVQYSHTCDTIQLITIAGKPEWKHL